MTEPQAPGFAGDLAVLPPEVVFQTAALGQLSGRLTLEHGTDRLDAYFDRGRLRFVTRRQSGPPLGEVLVQRGILRREDRDAALEELRRTPGRRLGNVLVARGCVDRTTLVAVLQERMMDVISTGLTWREGRFAFEAGAVPREEDVLLDVDLDRLLLECTERIDRARREWDDDGGV